MLLNIYSIFGPWDLITATLARQAKMVLYVNAVTFAVAISGFLCEEYNKLMEMENKGVM